MNAPDRIFAEEPDVFDGMGLWHSEGPYAEYIRADLHAIALAAAKAEGVPVAASLAAAISLLERGGKKAAPSDKMFYQMLKDYRESLDAFRKSYAAGEP